MTVMGSVNFMLIFSVILLENVLTLHKNNAKVQFTDEVIPTW